MFLEVLPCQYLCTMFPNMLFVTLTMLSLFLLSLQTPLSTTRHKVFFPSHTGSQFSTPAPPPQCHIPNSHLQLSHTAGVHPSGQNLREAPWHPLARLPRIQGNPPFRHAHVHLDAHDQDQHTTRTEDRTYKSVFSLPP